MHGEDRGGENQHYQTCRFFHTFPPHQENFMCSGSLNSSTLAFLFSNLSNPLLPHGHAFVDFHHDEVE
jgi:hypothetical protein